MFGKFSLASSFRARIGKKFYQDLVIFSDELRVETDCSRISESENLIFGNELLVINGQMVITSCWFSVNLLSFIDEFSSI